MPETEIHSLPAPDSRTGAALRSLALFAAPLLLTFCMGCSSSLHVAATSAPGSGSTPASPPPSAPPPSALSLEPSGATIQQWQTIQFNLSGESAAVACTWASSSASILAPVGDADFEGGQAGNATVSVVCGSQTVQAIVTVMPQAPSGPIKIVTGGTYSGNWTSNDPNTPAVTIATDDPVIVRDSVIASRGALIHVSGVSTGANVTIDNVTGTALDPQVAGMQRGAFVSATKIGTLAVTHCTMTGVSFGVVAVDSTAASIRIANNLALNLEDRASDGQGGLLAARPDLGHFVILGRIVAPAGAEIGWNKIVQTMGQSSVEDVINIFRSQGASGYPIWVHDNYIEGNSSPSAVANYTGTGIVADGSAAEPVTAFAVFENNEIVHTAGSGVAIDNGHDIAATGNRIVSCGQDASGTWFAVSYAVAADIWDAYGSGPQHFYNNTVTAAAGGLVHPNAEGNPVAADFWGSALSMTYPGNSASGNDFTNPCLTNGTLNPAAEDAERAYWTAKISAANEQIGDQHLGAN